MPHSLSVATLCSCACSRHRRWTSQMTPITDGKCWWNQVRNPISLLVLSHDYTLSTKLIRRQHRTSQMTPITDRKYCNATTVTHLRTILHSFTFAASLTFSFNTALFIYHLLFSIALFHISLILVQHCIVHISLTILMYIFLESNCSLSKILNLIELLTTFRTMGSGLVMRSECDVPGYSVVNWARLCKSNQLGFVNQIDLP